ncbi:MAG: AsmA-like C-terminal region-containing protein [Pirellulales bacterium]|nr:AsmA-like C-terminal region-containing protein [Pirellulales bacterium]
MEGPRHGGGTIGGWTANIGDGFIISRLINGCWWVFKVAFLLALAGGIGAGVYYFQHLHDEIRLSILQKLQGHYAQLKVEIRSAQLIQDEGIVVRGIKILDPQAPPEEQLLLSCDELLLSCATDLAQLAKGEPEFRSFTFRHPQLFARRGLDGRWNVEKLLPAPRFSRKSVEMQLLNGAVEIIDPTRAVPAQWSLRDLQVQLTPRVVSQYLTEPGWDARGQCRGDHLRQIHFQARVEPFTNAARVTGSIQGLQIGPELISALPTELATQLQPASVLRGELNLDYEIGYEAAAARPWTFEVVGRLQRGRIDDERIPQIWEDVHADFQANTHGMLLRELTAYNGKTRLTLAAERRGYAADSPISLSLNARNLMIGRDWEKSLPPPLLEMWQKFLPAGEVDVSGRLDYDGQNWRPSGEIRCLNVSFTYHKFPVRLDRTHGTLTWAEDRLRMNLTSHLAGRPVQISGLIEQPGPNYTGVVTIQGQKLGLDQSVLAALPEKPREVMESLHLNGQFQFFLQVTKNQAQDLIPHMAVRVDLENCTVKYDKFPYPLHSVRGTVELRDNVWTFRDLEGYNDTGRVTLRGELVPVADGNELRLTFTGTEIAIEPELRDALPPRAKVFWQRLQPRGMLDLQMAVVTYRTADKSLQIQITATPVGETVMFEPEFFPLRLEKVRGVFRYSPGKLEFADLTAEQERLPVRASGYCEYDNLGAWHVRFDKFVADRVRPERQTLQAALPAKLRKIVQLLHLEGALNLAGSFDLWGNTDVPQPVTAAWDGVVDLRDAKLKSGIELAHVDGTVRLQGKTNGTQLWLSGELAIDSLSTADLQLSNLAGPFYIDETQAIFGSQAIPKNSSPAPRHLQARCYDGNALADVWVGFGSVPQFLLLTRLENIDLAKIGQEQVPGKQQLSGKVNLGMELRGSGAGVHTLAGKGEMQLRDAQLGELPVMVAMLKLLSIREPDRTAFDAGDIRFRVEGEHIYLDSIELSGNAISLLGTGEMNLQRELQLVFAAVAGRSDWQLPGWKSFLGQTSQQFMEIHVGGTLMEPEIKRENFPALKEALDQLQAERRERRQQR